MKSVSKTKKKKLSYEINSPFRYPGGKYYARKLIMEHIPPHSTYIEPFCGGGSIFFAKPKAHMNILNDKDEELVNRWVSEDFCFNSLNSPFSEASSRIMRKFCLIVDSSICPK